MFSLVMNMFVWSAVAFLSRSYTKRSITIYNSLFFVFIKADISCNQYFLLLKNWPFSLLAAFLYTYGTLAILIRSLHNLNELVFFHLLSDQKLRLIHQWIDAWYRKSLGLLNKFNCLKIRVKKFRFKNNPKNSVLQNKF